MSVKFVAVQWNRKKLVYDAVLIVAIFAYVQLFTMVTYATLSGPEAYSGQIVAMRAWGTCAFLMLTTILCIGPLARLDRRFLPILYNRRHFGVIFFFVALKHGLEVIDHYHAYGAISKYVSLFTYDVAFTGASIPFQLFGVAALCIFFVMAATSHDFWQRMMGARAWKSLHMGVYLAYALVILHVAFGALQLEHHPLWVALVFSSVAVVGGLHLLAAMRSTALDTEVSKSLTLNGERWLDGGPASELVEGRPVAVEGPDGERIAVVFHEGGISAVHGVCAHQGGPLSEGRVIDGCLTCPWHGWQYLPANGQSPPPFTEKLPTYRVMVNDEGRVLVNPTPEAPGTALSPAPCPGRRES